MRLGVGSYTFTWAVGVPGSLPSKPLTALDLLERAASLGVRVVQFCDNLPLHILPDDELVVFDRRAQDLKLEVEVGTRGILPENLRTYLGLAQRLGSSIVRVVVDTSDFKPSIDEVIALVREVLPEYEQSKISLAIENHDRFTSAELAAMLKTVDSPYVGICLDTVNSFGALEGPEVVIETLSPWVVNLHIKDFTIRRANHQMGFVIEGTPAGQGRLDIPWLLKKLRAAGRDPNAVLELWTPSGYNLAATIAREEVWAECSIEYLRKLIPD